jgi:beta-glucosidase
VVQLYARARVPGNLPRRAVLVGFARARLDPGVTRALDVPILADAMAGLGLDDAQRGMLELWCSIDGPGAPDDDVISLTLERVPLER